VEQNGARAGTGKGPGRGTGQALKGSLRDLFSSLLGLTAYRRWQLSQRPQSGGSSSPKWRRMNAERQPSVSA